MPIVRKRLQVRSRQGLHARPAALFVQVANRFRSTVRVRKGRREVDGKSIMGLLTLAVSRGATIELIAQGSDATDALQALEQIVCRTEPPTLITIRRHAHPAGGGHRPSHGASTDHA
jgi:phosphotransferase system HPr (HPr) family protein